MKSAASARRRVAVVTGTRAEYGLFQSTLAALARDARCELQVVAAGMHLLHDFGDTLKQIRRDGWRVAAKIPMQRGRGDALDQIDGLARGLGGLARFFVKSGTDVVLVLGDRIEALAGALAGLMTGRLVAHVHGGDAAPGDFDDALRHAITKMSHLHLVASRESRRRVLRLGEEPRRVVLVGAPGLDRLLALRRGMPRRRGPSGRALVLQHAYGRPEAREQRVMTELLEAVRLAGLRRVVIYPNTDRGCRGVIRAIEAHARHYGPDEVTVHRSLPHEAYLRALLDADVLVGNSSSGMIEAPAAGTPTVNVGERQVGRQRGGPGVLDAAETRDGILNIVLRALRRPRRAAGGVYGDGHAGERIARALLAAPLTPEFMRKMITY